MRLLNTQTLRLETFLDGIKHNYAILSHTWGADEVSFEDVQSKPNSEWGKKAGASKVLRSAELALSHGFNYIWADTCCIDKSSSAELSEAINSMYRWYEESSVCYVYLSDMLAKDKAAQFSSRRWFTRGWTLQELISPSSVEFYDCEWSFIGSRDSLAQEIERITSIDILLLQQKTRPDLDIYSISQRMSWASRRYTTRPEDEAYCLMGLFNVNMPLLYGEGTKAFYRLQEEILKRTPDQSILVFDHQINLGSRLSLLAPSPRSFGGQPLIQRSLISRNSPDLIQLTHQGLQIRLYLYPILSGAYQTNVRMGLLDCFVVFENTSLSRPAIMVYKGEQRYFVASSGIYVVRPDREAVAVRVTQLNDSGYPFPHPEIIMDTDRMTKETVVLHAGPDYHTQERPFPFHESRPLRLKQIWQSKGATHSFGPSIPNNFGSRNGITYSFGPSKPARSCELMSIHSAFPSNISQHTFAIISIISESRAGIGIPLLLVLYWAYGIEAGHQPDFANGICIMENLYTFPSSHDVSPEILEEALRYNTNHHSPTSELEHQDDQLLATLSLSNGCKYSATLKWILWHDRDLLDLELTAED